MALFQIPSWHMPGGTEGNYEKSQDHQPLDGDSGCFLNTGQKQYCWIQLGWFLTEICYLCLKDRANMSLLRTRQQLINNCVRK
jgi:hypothetical protein